MRKILSVILCAALVFGMLPAAFATTAGETETLEYVFRGSAYGVATQSTSGTKSFDDVEYFDQDGKNLIDTSISKNVWYYVSSHNNATVCYRLNKSTIPYIATYQQTLGENAVCFAIEVPNSGTYSPVMSYFTATTGSRINAYAVSAALANEKGWDMTTSTALANVVSDANSENSEVQLFASNDTYSESGKGWSGEYTLLDGDFYNSVYLDSGVNYIVFSIDGDNSAFKEVAASNAAYYYYMNSLTLTKLTPASIEVSADATEIDINGTAKFTSVVKTADGSEIPAKVNYSSSNSVVSVDEDGNVTAGSNPGTATITATVDGTTVSETITIRVTKSYDYVFWASARTEGVDLADSEYLSIPAGGAGYNMVEGESEPWDYMVQYGISSWACRKKEYATRFSAEIVDGVFNPSNMFAYKVKFSETGKYVPTLYYQPYITGGKVQVFLVPATWAESGDGFGDDGILNVNTEGLSIISGARVNNKCIGEADTYSTAASPSTAVVDYTTFAETEITEEEYYLLFSMSGVNEDAEPFCNTSKGTYHYYAYLSSLSFKKTGELENVEAPTVALAVAYGDEDPTVTSYPRGKEITLTAPDKTSEGLTFRHWVRGTADGGDWITNSETYSFTLATNTYLTAVYTETASETDKIVEFWGGNGEYLTEATADADGKVEFPDEPKLTGFKFLQWIVAKNTPVTSDTVFTDEVTRVVAEFEDDDVKFKVGDAEYLYDHKVHNEGTEEKAWYRDGVLVGYGTEYDYYVWDAVGTITSEAVTGEKAPVVVLDDTVKEEKACMIEYDTAGKDVAEVGIVFGTASATVDSCNSKATSQKKLSHGQFTAKPNAKGSAAYARGYIIYNDAGVYRVTYTGAVALNSDN